MNRIGLFGGSFDPVHLGHLLIARAALEELALDRLFFIPAAKSPFKPDSAPAPGPLRAAWLRLALAGWSRAEVDDRELEGGGVSFTIDTVRAYRLRYPQVRLFWLIGADHVVSLPLWREAGALAAEVEFAAAARPGEVSSSAPPGFRVHFLRGCPVAISSSDVRARVRTGLPIDALVPPAVAEAVRNSGLYL